MEGDSEDFETIQKTICEIISTKGIEYLHEYIRKKSEKWKEEVLNIGLLGESGAGKSFFINKIRGLKRGDDGYAETATYMDTTSERKKYTTKGNPNIIFWDLVGCGTIKSPRDEAFLKLVKLEEYDFVILMSSKCFSENDAWLAQKVYRSGKPLFFVRTKLDEDLLHATHDEEDIDDVLPRIRERCKENLAKSGIHEPNIFIISNYDHSLGDFDELMSAIFFALPNQKKEALLYSLPPLSHKVINDKKNQLIRRVFLVAILSSTAAAVPVPLVDFAADIAILTKEVRFYLQEFGLTEEQLKNLCKIRNLDYKTIMQTLPHVKHLLMVGIKEAIILGVKDKAVEESAKTIAKQWSKFIPVIGTAVSSTLAYTACCAMLFHELGRISEEAHRVLDIMVRGKQVKENK